MSNRNCCEIFLPDYQQTYSLGFLLGEHLTPGSNILLQGNLGAGKTSLVQGLGAGLGIDEAIASPTFTIVNEYSTGRIPLYHLDLYRLTPEQASNVYPEIYWEGEEVEPGIVAIEWSERLLFFPESYIKISLSLNTTKGRTAKVSLFGECDLDLDIIDTDASVF